MPAVKSPIELSIEKLDFLTAFGFVPSSTGNYWSNRHRLRGEKRVKFTRAEIIHLDVEQLEDMFHTRLTEDVSNRNHGQETIASFQNIVQPALTRIFNEVYSNLNSGDPSEERERIMNSGNLNAPTREERARIRQER